MTKRRTLRDRAFEYSKKARAFGLHDTEGPWFYGYKSGLFDGWIAGYCSAKRERKS